MRQKGKTFGDLFVLIVGYPVLEIDGVFGVRQLWYLYLYRWWEHQRPDSNRHGTVGPLVGTLLTVPAVHKSRISTAWELALLSHSGERHQPQNSETSPIQDGGNGHRPAQQAPLRGRAPCVDTLNRLGFELPSVGRRECGDLCRLSGNLKQKP